MNIEEIRAHLRSLDLDPFAVGIAGQRGASIDCGYLLQRTEGGVSVLFQERGAADVRAHFRTEREAMTYVIERLEAERGLVGTRSAPSEASRKRMREYSERVLREIAEREGESGHGAKD